VPADAVDPDTYGHSDDHRQDDDHSAARTPQPVDDEAEQTHAHTGTRASLREVREWVVEPLTGDLSRVPARVDVGADGSTRGRRVCFPVLPHVPG
jgi:hypothetical protein